MKNIGNSLKLHLKEIALNDSPLFNISSPFPQYRNFTPVPYWGEVPYLFSFDENFLSYNQWLNVRDGYAFLIPLIFSEQFKQIKNHLILPEEVSPFLKSDLDFFYYSRPCFLDPIPDDTFESCYVITDFFEHHTHKSLWQKNLEDIKSYASRYKEVTIVLNAILPAFFLDSSQGDFLESIRTLPENCRIISIGSFLGLKDLNQKRVHFLLDTDINLRTPLEDQALMRNGIIETEKTPDDDELVHSYSIYPRVKINIYKKLVTSSLKPEAEERIKILLRAIKSPEDLIDLTYRRLLNEVLDLKRNI